MVTPVRRSARKSVATPLIASMLRETEFAYAPNEALARPRVSMFDTNVAASEDKAASNQHDDDGNSTPTSVTGTSFGFSLQHNTLYGCFVCMSRSPS